MSWLTLFSMTLIVTMIIMMATWFLSLKIDNYGIVDAVWSLSFILHGGLFFYFSDGNTVRSCLVFLMLGLWSMRLGFFLTKRIASHHPIEDARYQNLRTEYGINYKWRFFLFFMLQALSVSILTLPFIFVFKNSSSEISIVEKIGILVWIISLVGESLADHQMNQFKKLSKINPQIGRTCNIGLWRYSRHPNYFFESNIWWGFFLIMAGSGAFWGIYTAFIILFLLLKVTGVPPSEEQALKSRGDEYRAYQRQTSVFIPWRPRP